EARTEESGNTAGKLRSRGVRVRNPRQRVNIVLKCAPDVGQVFNLALVDGVGLLSSLDLDKRHVGGHHNFGANAPGAQLHIVDASLSDGKLDFAEHRGFKSGRLDAN